MRKYFLLFVMSFFYQSFAHEGVSVKETYNNIVLTSFTESYTEDINKALIVGQYAEMLAKKYSYSKKIYIHFIQKEEVYIKSWFPNLDEDSDYKDGLNIMIKTYNLDITGALNVVEYSIKNSTKKNLFNANFELIYHNKPSSDLIKTLDVKIDRPIVVEELNKPDFLNYYFKNNKYHFIYKRVKIEEEVLITEKLFDFKVLNVDLFIVFTGYNEFKIIKQGSILKTLKIDNVDEFFKPYKIILVGTNKLIIEHSNISKYHKNVMLYFIDKDKFIQDIDSLN